MATRKRINKKQDRGGRRNQMIPHPPPIQSFGLTHATKLRFISNAAVNQTVITFQNLLDTLNVATAAAVSFQLFYRVRVRAVEMWANPVIGNATTVQCEFIGSTVGDQGDTRIHSDTSMGIEPAHVRASPAARSGVALFQGSSAQSAFLLTCPAGTVVDVELSFRGLPGIATATQNAPAGAIVGAWYYRGLDGLAAAATVFVPVINASGQN
jgi:hypothetical protein